MNPLFAEFLAVLLRWGLTSLGAYLVSHHAMTADQADRFSNAIVEHVLLWAPGALALLWALVAKYRGRVKFLTALDAPAGTTENGIDVRVANGLGASVKTGTLVMLLACVLVAGALTMPGCAATQPPAGTYSNAGLKAFDADKLLKDITVNATKTWPTEAEVRAALPVDYQKLQDAWAAWRPSGDGSLHS